MKRGAIFLWRCLIDVLGGSDRKKIAEGARIWLNGGSILVLIFPLAPIQPTTLLIMKASIFKLSLSAAALFLTAGVQSGSAAAIVIDNGDAGYSVSGVTEQITVAPGTIAYGDDHAFNTSPGDLSAVANYTFSGLANGSYEVFASWRLGGQNNTGLMTVSVSDSGPTVDVNQFFNPAGGGTPGNGGPLSDLVLNDGTRDIDFQSIGLVTVADGELVVSTSLSAASTQSFFINDAIAINLVPEPSAALLGVLSLGLLTARRRR